MATHIHSTAIVDPKANLAENVEVGAYSIIGPDVTIGSGTRVAPHVMIEGRTTIGANCELFQFSSIGAKPQDLKYHGEPSTLTIGDKNIIREYVTLQPGTEGGGMTTTIGDGNLFMANSHVGHDCDVGNGNILSNSVALAGHVTVEDSVILGGLVGVHQFVRLGSHSFLGAGSMVGHDIPPYCFGQGDRCHLRGINLIGLQRAKLCAEDVTAIKKAYRHLFGSTGGAVQKIDSLPEEIASNSAIQHFTTFIRESERGVAQPLRNVGRSD